MSGPNSTTAYLRERQPDGGLLHRACLPQSALDHAVARKDQIELAKDKNIEVPPRLAGVVVGRYCDRCLGFYAIRSRATEPIREILAAMDSGGGTTGLIRNNIFVQALLSEFTKQMLTLTRSSICHIST